jgi:metal transporter CNNM
MDLHGDHLGGMVPKEQIAMMKGALSFGDKKVGEIMHPLKEVFMLEVKQKLDFALLMEIFKRGYSRVPVYDDERKGNVLGILIVKVPSAVPHTTC